MTDRSFVESAHSALMSSFDDECYKDTKRRKPRDIRIRYIGPSGVSGVYGWVCAIDGLSFSRNRAKALKLRSMKQAKLCAKKIAARFPRSYLEITKNTRVVALIGNVPILDRMAKIDLD